MCHKRFIYTAAGVLAVCFSWYLTCDYFSLLPRDSIPGLLEVGDSFLEGLENGLLLEDTRATLIRWSLGFSLGAGLGTLLGLLLGLSDTLWKILEMPLEFVRGIPVTAMLPLFFLLLGVGEGSKIAMAALPSFLLLAIYCAGGVRRCSRQRREMALVFGGSRFQIFRYITLPETCPFLLLGLRLACSLSLTVAVVAEMFVGTSRGVGQRLFESYMMSNTAALFQNILLIGVIGYSSSFLIGALEKNSLRWVGK